MLLLYSYKFLVILPILAAVVALSRINQYTDGQQMTRWEKVWAIDYFKSCVSQTIIVLCFITFAFWSAYKIDLFNVIPDPPLPDQITLDAINNINVGDYVIYEPDTGHRSLFGRVSGFGNFDGPKIHVISEGLQYHTWKEQDAYLCNPVFITVIPEKEVGLCPNCAYVKHLNGKKICKDCNYILSDI